jgi:putative ABC transport system permease protein
VRLTDRIGLGLLATKARPARSLLSACGIAIGIAALVAVMGLASSSKADLMAQLNALGTNLLTVSPGQSPLGEDAVLPDQAPEMVSRIGSVEAASSVYSIDSKVFKTDRISPAQTSGLSVRGADLSLLETLRAGLAEGAWLNPATAAGPAAVLGAKAAQRLAVSDVGGGVAIHLGGQWFAVVGILEPVSLAPEIDTQVLIGEPAARALAGAAQDLPPAWAEVPPSRIYARIADGYVDATRDLLARTANPGSPAVAEVSRPSDALAAQAATDASLTALSLGLGAVGLGVGGIGIANVMVIAVLERRREIGVRRALGATRRSIRGQFLIESVVLAALGGLLGAALGVAAAFGFAEFQGWARVVPWSAIGLGLGASLVIGAAAGAYPAGRAARVSPTEALRTA